MPKVRDIMTVDVKAAEPDTSLEELSCMMRDEDVGSIPVLEDGELRGIITDRDIVVRCIAEGSDPCKIMAEDIISEDLETIDPDADVQEAARLMSEHQIRRLPVVEDGRLLGMVSLGDIAVKHENERVSGQVLEDISEGVKPSRGIQGKKKPVSISEGWRASTLAEQGQGIAHQSAQREQGRQQRVNPPRASSKRRKVS